MCSNISGCVIVMSATCLLQIQLPGPLGMILTGMALANINGGHIIRGLPNTWSKELRAIALSIIFLRSGLELELKVPLLGCVFLTRFSGFLSI